MNPRQTDTALTIEHTRRAIVELLQSAGAAGLDDDELGAAFDQLVTVYVDAGLWALWNTGEITVGWERGELAWRARDAGPLRHENGGEHR